MLKILVLSLIIGLSNNIITINLNEHHWVDYANLVNEDGTEIRMKTLSIKNDSVYSFLYLTGETKAFPLKIKDSLFIFKRSEHKHHNLTTFQEDTTYIDSMIYEFKYIQNQPILILQPIDGSKPQVLHTLNETKGILETNNLNIPEIEYFNYEIGDTLNQEKLITLNKRFSSIYYFDLQHKVLLSNNEKNFYYINDEKIILEIQQPKIVRSKINNIRNYFIKSLGFNPEITYNQSKNKSIDGYKWENNYIYIYLHKTDSKPNKETNFWRIDYINKLILNVLNEENLR